MSNGTTTWNYTYNADGLRTSRTNGTNTYTYTYNGDKLTYMTVNGYLHLYFAYDASGVPISVIYNGVMFYYVTNVQGDVIGLLDSTGNQVVSYSYDAWGNILSVEGSLKDTLGTHNPLRYRSYVYDSETKLYYLQSRYYNPETGRFLNADGLISTGHGLLGYNMFLYCNNNPIMYTDSTGTRLVGISLQLEVQGGNTSVGMELVIYFDPIVCNGADYLIVMYSYSGYEIPLSQLQSFLNVIDVAALATLADQQDQGQDALMAVARSLMFGASGSLGLGLVFGNDNFEDPEDYSGIFETWSMSKNGPGLGGSVYYSYSDTCQVYGVKVTYSVLGFSVTTAILLPFDVSYSQTEYSDPITLMEGYF